MNFEKLLDEKKIEEIEKEEFSSEFAEKDLETAKRNLINKDFDWAVSIAYNAVLRVGRSVMTMFGYRAIGKEHHKNLFEFLRETEFDLDLIDYFDNIRKQRNSFVYRDFEVASKESTEETLKKAEEFVQKIRTFVQKIRTNKQEKSL